MFSPEELSAMAAADAEIEAEFSEFFPLRQEQLLIDAELDRVARQQARDNVKNRRREYDRAYRKRHPDRVKESNRRYRALHIEQCLSRVRSSKAQNRSTYRERDKLQHRMKKAARESTSPTSGARKNNPTAIIQPESEICQ